ncbi:hypothetical protein N494_18760 (plasmid) [Clostridium botulinum A2B7 92]|uniref:Uncharacterized protein n=1 Tax=Clostridium botulinum TaxID=1491 RepID=A0A846JI59_CLOBO|nr:hypothetical protein [Clostridium botulinum]EKX80605.1 hypothetical protein CFSAN001628_005489 [Clostridium botulinum CFSAN001628]ACA57570.1 hypothetical protein CLK_A0261 [Clostridium botulinum A3 str. Loch Maree]KEI94154.1 hypothetical protein N494_18760 [Clostridium botulinum A2B7 92]MBD5563707.1 hypothetical protein [Clostridium botulinum]MBD5568435.1 hypothetical protein [Clostridium botulinum]
MKKPANRKERVNFIIKKKGLDFANFTLLMSDGEVKKFFDKLWENGLRNMPDYEVPELEPSICLRCGTEITWHSECGCGEDMAIIDQLDWDEEEKSLRNFMS